MSLYPSASVRRRPVLVFVAAALLAACGIAPTPTPRPPQLSFEVALAVNDEGETEAQFGLRNEGESHFPGAEDFNGRFLLLDADGGLLGEGSLGPITSLGAGEPTYPIDWRGELTPGAYRMVWGAPGYGAVEVDFDILEAEGQRSLGEQTVRPVGPEEAEEVLSQGR